MRGRELAQDQASAGYLPDFCNVRMVFAVVVLAQLLAFILALGPSLPEGEMWIQLSLVSLFIQWIALSNCALLCLCRPIFNRLATSWLTLACLVVVLLVTLLISELGFVLSRHSAIVYMIPPSWHSQFLLHNAMISVIIGGVALRYFYLQNQLQLTLEARAEARLQALQSRIRPHFLFNSMNTIASLTRSQPAVAEAMVEDLADLFRVSLAADENEVPIEDELRLCRGYLNIEQNRLGDRLQVVWHIDALAPGVRVPALSLQPLVENAIYHGIEPLAQGGRVEIKVYIKQEHIIIEVINPVAKASAPSGLVVKRSTMPKRASHHIALDNIRARLSVLYGDKAKLELVPESDCFTARLLIPYHGNAP